VDTLNKDQVMSGVRTMAQIKSEALGGTEFQTTLLVAFSAVALLLAAVGIYGVISYSVAERTHEIGLRAALGADANNLRRLVLGNALLLAVVGLTCGAIGTYGLGRALSTLLFGVGAHDPVTIVGAAVVVVIVSLAASYVPARRATKVDPIVALRYD
jgi:ABC-type antimicrobial peptide transport system permease subunit